MNTNLTPSPSRIESKPAVNQPQDTVVVPPTKQVPVTEAQKYFNNMTKDANHMQLLFADSITTTNRRFMAMFGV